MKIQIQIRRVVLVGSTTWDTSEYRTLGRFRGSIDKLVAVRDGKGKLAAKATRLVVIWVVCEDRVAYRFEHTLEDAKLSEPSCTVRVHGYSHNVCEDELPLLVAVAARRAARRVRALLRLLRAEALALPVLQLR